MRTIHPGLHQIETEAGGNRLCLYLLTGDQQVLLDSGTRHTPHEVILPALQETGLPETIDTLLISHADADHHGGNNALHQHMPEMQIVCHELDRARVQSKQAHMVGRYKDVVVADDFTYESDFLDAIADMIGDDTPVHSTLQGGETLTVGEHTYHVLHTPGHTAGHIALWDADRRVLLMQDAVLGAGTPDKAGNVLSPPPYYDVPAYTDTICSLQALEPEHVFTAHYPDMGVEEAQQFFDESLACVKKVGISVIAALSKANEPLSLTEIMTALDAKLGPYEVDIQWVGPALAHLQDLENQGHICSNNVDGVRLWQIA